MNDIIDTFIEVILPVGDDGTVKESFLKVRETLQRIGIASRKNKTLYQICHILHKRGRYYITHFLELFMLDGKRREFSKEDRARRNTIALLLEEWGMVEIIDRQPIYSERAPMKNICIIPFKYKENWNLKAKYSIGRVK